MVWHGMEHKLQPTGGRMGGWVDGWFVGGGGALCTVYCTAGKAPWTDAPLTGRRTWPIDPPDFQPRMALHAAEAAELGDGLTAQSKHSLPPLRATPPDLQYVLDGLGDDPFLDRQLLDVLMHEARPPGGEGLGHSAGCVEQALSATPPLPHDHQRGRTLMTKTSPDSWKISSILSRFSAADTPFFGAMAAGPLTKHAGAAHTEQFGI